MVFVRLDEEDTVDGIIEATEDNQSNSSVGSDSIGMVVVSVDDEEEACISNS